MGWFNDLIIERKEKNQEIFESSFTNLTANVLKGSKEENDLNHKAINQILKYYHIANDEVPKDIYDLPSEVENQLSRHNLLTRKIKLEGSWQNENTEPILVFSRKNHIPIVLHPNRRLSAYYYYHPRNGKVVWATSPLATKLSSEAITFYRPLPKEKLTLKEYFKYIRSCIKPFDIILLISLIIIVTLVGMINPYLIRKLTGEVVDDKNMSLFISTAIFMVCASILTLALKTSQNIVNARVSIKIEHSLHSAVMMRLLSLPTSFFRKYNTGELNARVSSVSSLCNMIISGILVLGVSSLISLVYLVQIHSFAPVLILPSLLVILVNVIFLILLSFIEKRIIRKQTRLDAKENGLTYSLINGIQKIRLSGSEKRAFAKWADLYTESAKAQYSFPLIIKIAPAISLAISLLGDLLIYWLVAKNSVPTASYVAFTSSYAALSAALMLLTTVVSNIVKIPPMLEMIQPIIEAEPENAGDREKVENLTGSIKLDHVSFKYEEDGPNVIDDLSLDIKAGEYVSIVGATGCGKSTIVRLLLGFEEATLGHIYYDDKDINTLDLSSLRKEIGSVTQNGTLFHADILSNILITALNLTEDDAWEAAKIANIDNDIKMMPMGMHTVISEGQGSISGGQKQRIMIARAIVHKPKILIFDEATSALDNESQKKISEAIDSLNVTRIVIAHRLSTIIHSDRIIFIEKGKVVESGTYDELVKLNGKFAELVERQRLDK